VSGSSELVRRVDPWERMPSETATAFHAFAIFRDLGFSRSLSQVAEVIVEAAPRRKRPTVLSQVKSWSAAHSWVARAEAYDVYLDRRQRERREGDVARMHRRYQGAAAAMQTKILERLGPSPGEGVVPLDASELGFAEAVSALAKLQTIEGNASARVTQSLKKLSMITIPEMEEMLTALTTGLLQFIPEERLPLAGQWLLAFAETGKAPY
jgi:hypothetical protein